MALKLQRQPQDEDETEVTLIGRGLSTINMELWNETQPDPTFVTRLILSNNSLENITLFCKRFVNMEHFDVRCVVCVIGLF